MLAPLRGSARLTWALLACPSLFCTAVVAGDSIRRYGTPTPGSGNIAPTIWANGTPRPGDAGFRLRVERALGGTWTFPFYSARAGDATFGGIRFLIDTSVAVYGGAYFLTGQGDGGGSGDVPAPLPNNPALLGAALYVQAFTLDDFAPNPLGFAATTGLRLVPALPGELLVSRSLVGEPDPQTAIDLAAGTVVDYDRTHFAQGSGVAYANGGRVALQPDPATARLRIFATATFPPTWQANAALAHDGPVAGIAVTPDGSRAYVLYGGDPGESPPIAAHDARPGPGLGQPWPGAPIRLEQVADPRAIAFTPDSTVAFVAALGPRSGGAGSLTRIDVDPTSTTFHQATGVLVFDGKFATGVAISPDGETLYVPLVATGQPGEIAVVDVATFTVRDMDPGTAGVQNLGGETSVPRTPLPAVLGSCIADPRGEELFCASLGAVVRAHVAEDSPAFRRVTTLAANLAPAQLVQHLALSDAGERLYVATDVHVVEFDTARLTSPRAWPIVGATGLALR